jgi:hypothetical protein
VRGTPADLELVFNSACRGVFPSKAVVRPYFVLVFELLRIPEAYAKLLNLPGRQSPPRTPVPASLPLVTAHVPTFLTHILISL